MWIATILLAGAAGLVAAGPAAAEGASLRQALEQYHSTASAATPWRLSAEQRAELRRQLAESASRGEARGHGEEASRLATRDATTELTPKKRNPRR